MSQERSRRAWWRLTQAQPIFKVYSGSSMVLCHHCPRSAYICKPCPYSHQYQHYLSSLQTQSLHIIWFPFVISFVSILYNIRFIYSTNINQEPSNSQFDFSHNEDHSNSHCVYLDICSYWTFRAGAGPRARRF